MKGYRKEGGGDRLRRLATPEMSSISSDYLRVVDPQKERSSTRPEKHVAGQHRGLPCSAYLVGVMMAIGDGRTYNTALLVFDADSLGPYAAPAWPRCLARGSGG